MADFGLAHGLNELRGQHGIAFDTLGHHESRGNRAQPQRHGSDDEKAAQGEPAQQIERPTPALAFCSRRLRRRCSVLFQYLHGRVLDACIKPFQPCFESV
ncbi:hypothetical protein D3C85_1725330 [compost metagenome]